MLVLALVRVWSIRVERHYGPSRVHLGMLVRIEIILHSREHGHRLGNIPTVNLLFAVMGQLHSVVMPVVQDRNSLLADVLIKAERT